MSVVYPLDLPMWRATPLNRLLSMHYMEAHKQKKRDKRAGAGAWLASRHPPATSKRRVTVILTYAKGERAHDPDAMQKVLGDALVECGALRNDSPRWVEWSPFQYERSGDERFSTRILLEDM